MMFMELRKHSEVIKRIYELVGTGEPGEAARPLRSFARRELDSGYPREALLEDFEHVRADLSDRDDEVREDEIVGVMDALVGYCPPAARL